MKLTRQMILRGRSKRGGWTRKQLAILGVSYPPQKGWLDATEGKEVPDRVYEEFMREQKDPPDDSNVSVNLAARYRKELGLPAFPGD